MQNESTPQAPAPVVVKLGGAILADAEATAAVWAGVAAMAEPVTRRGRKILRIMILRFLRRCSLACAQSENGPGNRLFHEPDTTKPCDLIIT